MQDEDVNIGIGIEFEPPVATDGKERERRLVEAMFVPLCDEHIVHHQRMRSKRVANLIGCLQRIKDECALRFVVVTEID